MCVRACMCICVCVCVCMHVCTTDENGNGGMADNGPDDGEVKMRRPAKSQTSLLL